MGSHIFLSSITSPVLGHPFILCSTLIPIGVLGVSCAAIVTPIVLNKRISLRDYVDALLINNFDEIKLVDPLKEDEAKWEIVATSREEAYKKTAEKYYNLCKQNSKYFEQDLMHYIWKAIRCIKNNIPDFQGEFYFKIENLNFVYDANAKNFLRANFDIDYKANLTYNDYEWFQPYVTGYQTQVNLKGKYEVKNLYFNVHYQDYDETTGKATKPTFEIVANPLAESNKTTCVSTGSGHITYFDIYGDRQTYERTETITYDTAFTPEMAATAYYQDPIFAFVLYWYQELMPTYSMLSYSLENVETTIKGE